MTGCDRCQCFADQLTSLDGFTLLCHNCQQEVVKQKERLVHHPPFMEESIQPVWTYLMKNATPFRIVRESNRCTLVFYGSGALWNVGSLLQKWCSVPQDQIPDGVVDFGRPTEDCDIDGRPMKTSFAVYRLATSMISVEEYGCWVKVQMWV